jgi:tRNA(fMet)-specific endonuclease VapC
VPVKHIRGVLDTSVVILLDRLSDDELLPPVPLITAITLAELSAGPLVATDEIERARRLSHLQQAEVAFNPLPFDADAARVFGSVSASLRQAGRKSAARGKDAMIASIALAGRLPVYTCNARDFERIEGLEVVPVPVPI